VTAYSVVVDPASSSNIKVAYTISVTNLVNTYVQIYTQLTEEIADGTFNNLLHIFAAGKRNFKFLYIAGILFNVECHIRYLSSVLLS